MALAASIAAVLIVCVSATIAHAAQGCIPERLNGDVRYDTMALAVQEGFPSGASCDTAVIASGENFPDALAASSLAGALDCPLITTNDKALSEQARKELVRLGVKKAYVLGSDKAVSNAVTSTIGALNGGIEVERLAGKTRVGTAIAVAKEVAAQEGDSDTCIVTKSSNFPDALAISAWAARTSSPIFYAENGVLDSSAIATIKNGGYSKVVVLGDGKMENDGVQDAAISSLGLQWIRLAGSNRYETTRAVVEWEIGNDSSKAFAPSGNQVLSLDGLAVATGESFMDALASVNVTNAHGSALLLAYDNNEAQDLFDDVVSPESMNINEAFVMGSASAVSATVYNWLATALEPSKYNYEVYALGSHPIYTGSAFPFYIRTESPTPGESFGFEVENNSISTVVGVEFADVPYDGDTQIYNMRKVEGGWLLVLRFDIAGPTTLTIYDEPEYSFWSGRIDGRKAAKATFDVLDYSRAESEWIDEKIAKYTDSSMNSLEKLQAVANGLYFNEFSYSYNAVDESGNSYYVNLASNYGPYFETYHWDSYTSPYALCKIAERIGGFSDIHNCYGDSPIGSAEWLSTHWFCRVTFEGEDHYVQACPLSPTGEVDLATLPIIDLSDTGSLRLLS